MSSFSLRCHYKKVFINVTILQIYPVLLCLIRKVHHSHPPPFFPFMSWIWYDSCKLMNRIVRRQTYCATAYTSITLYYSFIWIQTQLVGRHVLLKRNANKMTFNQFIDWMSLNSERINQIWTLIIPTDCDWIFRN